MGECPLVWRSSLLVLGLCSSLTACQTDGGDVAGTNLSRPVVALNATSTTTAPISSGAQAYSATPESKVEASVATATSNSAGRTSEKFNLFKTLNENDKRTSTKTSTSKRVLTVKGDVRSPAKSARRISKMTILPGVRTQTQTALQSVRSLGSRATKKATKLSEPVRLASAAALSRLSKHGLRTQHSKVSVGCLKPSLVKLIQRAERHFGRHAVVTSGYRSPRHNRRIGGARNSMHVSCQAADVQIKGVTKWKLASWFRKQSGRGGVGTYCHTQSVHIDIGKERDWNWRCKRRRGKRRKA